MSLEFVNQPPTFNSRTDAVRLFAVDGCDATMFIVSREALEDLEGVESLDNEGAVLSAFEKHIDRIHEAARRAYRSDAPSSSRGGYILSTRHFA